MSMVDAFAADNFQMASLTEAINTLPYVPTRIREMGVFEPQGVRTTAISVEESGGVLTLIPTQVRGGTPKVRGKDRRKMRSLTVPHIPYEDTILPGDVQDLRAFGSETQEQAINDVVNQRLGDMRQDIEVTHEYLMVGALHGNILDSDGSTVIYNLFDEFEVVEVTQDFAFTTATTKVRQLCLAVKRAIEDALGNAVYQHIHAICGSNWFDALIDHADVRTAYERFAAGEQLRNDPRAGFPFGGIIFEEYRGSIGGTSFINTDQARFFPVGTPRLFKMYYAPGDFMETVNTMGLPFYAKQEILSLDRGVKLHVQSNPLPICHRPKCLVKGTKS